MQNSAGPTKKSAGQAHYVTKSAEKSADLFWNTAAFSDPPIIIADFSETDPPNTDIFFTKKVTFYWIGLIRPDSKPAEK